MYSWGLQISTLSNGATYGVNPRYDQPKRTVKMVEGEVFHREEWDIELFFQRADYTLIYERELETEFVIKAYDDQTPGADPVWQGRFTRIDCEIDEDNETIKVKPKTYDRYEDILTSLDKEFDLIALEPEITPVDVVRQPLIQVNLEGSEIVSNYLGGSYWETSLAGDFNEGNNVRKTYIVPGDSDVLSPDISGEYWYDDVDFEHYRLDNQYYFKFDTHTSKWQVWQVGSPDVVVYQATTVGDMPAMDTPFTPSSLTFESVSSSTTCKVFPCSIRARLLTNKTTVNGNATTAIPSGDNNENNGTYTRVIRLIDAGTLPINELNVVFSASSLHSTEATKYNKFASDSLHFADEYFVKPGSGYLPIQRNEWTGYALWFNYNSTIQDLQTEAGEEITIKDCYKLPDVLKVLLAEISPDYTHLESNSFSNFIYGANSIRGTRRYPIITPKTNLLSGNYDQPAAKANIKLNDVLTMLKYVYNVYWWVDEDYNFRLEHLNYFERGGQYYTDNVGTDLTTSLEPKTGKSWGYRLNKYTYEKQNMPERVTTKWMDNQSFAFEGSPIVMRSEYAEKGNLEERVVSVFSADIDYMFANTSDISKDGFALFDCERSGGIYSPPFVNLSLWGYDGVKAQNGYLSLAWLSNNYHRYGMPTHNINVNGTDTTAITTKRTKVQEIEFAAFDFNPMELIKTDIGTGQIYELEQEIMDTDETGTKKGAIKGKIRHDIL
jgi:hypothetical protein